jgi:hypothetical protein
MFRQRLTKSQPTHLSLWLRSETGVKVDEG